jgi:hypothetical protein
LLILSAGTCASAQLAGGEQGMPGMETHRIEEPVFSGRVAVYEAGRGKAGMLVSGSTVVMTGGRIEGNVAISAYASRLDLAAVEVEGREAAVKASRRSYVVFSLSRLKSPYTDGVVHDFVTVTDKNPR